MNKTVFIEFPINIPYVEFAYKDIAKVIEQHNKDGYKVVSITPLTGSDEADNVYPDNQKMVTYTKVGIIVFEKLNNS